MQTTRIRITAAHTDPVMVFQNGRTRHLAVGAEHDVAEEVVSALTDAAHVTFEEVLPEPETEADASGDPDTEADASEGDTTPEPTPLTEGEAPASVETDEDEPESDEDDEDEQ